MDTLSKKRKMIWGSAASDLDSIKEAVQKTTEQIKIQLGTREADLVFIFISPHHVDAFQDLPGLLGPIFGDAVLVGCSGEGVIGGNREIQRRPGLAISAASLPNVDITPFHVEQKNIPNADAQPLAWEQIIGVDSKEQPLIILLPDSFTIQTEDLVSGLDYAFPESIKIGGLASGGNQKSSNALFMGSRTLHTGVVGVALVGDIQVETVVAQGCRPIGHAAVIQKSEQNVIHKLGDCPPLDILRDLFQNATEKDRELMRRALHIGIVMDPLSHTFTAGDFLIRNFLGLDEKTGSMAVSQLLEEGQVVQFHLRDANSAREDLKSLLKLHSSTNKNFRPEAALLFSCLSRGQNLFGKPDHDTSMFQLMVADVPTAGFFCNGEIAPVGNSTFLHGHTSAFAILGQHSGD